MTPISRLNKVQINDLVERVLAKQFLADGRDTKLRMFRIIFRTCEHFHSAKMPGFFWHTCYDLRMWGKRHAA